MRFIYFDLETTGIKPGSDRIVEIALLDPVKERSQSWLVNPECPIPQEASRIHMITDDMVKDAPVLSQVMPEFLSFLDGEVILVAHNCFAFDKPFLEGECKRIGINPPKCHFADSLIWARKYRSDLPKHSLQFLREVYQIEANTAHRALDDVIILARVFSKMIDDLPPKTVLELLSQDKKLTRMPFGKHQGKELDKVPPDYVAWLNKSGAFDKEENKNLKAAFEKLGLLSDKPPLAKA